MRSFGFALLALLVAGSPAVAAGAPAEASPWRAAVSAELAALGSESPSISAKVLTMVIGAAERELGALDPAEAAPVVLEAALRAELRWRLGTPLPRLGAELRQEFRVTLGTAADHGERRRALERVRRRLERETPVAGITSAPWGREGPAREGRSP